MQEKKLTILIPAHNEEAIIKKTVQVFHKSLRLNEISHEILVVNDHSQDNTEKILLQLKGEIKELDYINNDYQRGFGSTIIKGLRNFTGDYVAIVMADLSDHPEDIVKFYHEMNKGYDCVFGSRFIKGGKTIDYPLHKLVLNRLGNSIIRLLFGMQYNDTTNACKMYRKETITGLEPFLSKHFNLTVELPLKAIVRGYSYSVLPNKWKNRTTGIAKFKVKEMGSRYFFIIFYCLIEKLLSQGDYKKRREND
ncbi:family 2 glycosyl transferase [Candidatus Pacearchaeota archaeon]|nr:family 2 glycosyl transferase [Candidatus Pacearchaeota archaeon]|tara:strand:- start:85 stop:837 length:753 start_codon:yes stop_codon:yes gene_type:complete